MKLILWFQCFCLLFNVKILKFSDRVWRGKLFFLESFDGFF